MAFVAKADTYAANVSLLLPFDADLTDYSASPKTMTAAGTAAVSATQKKYGAKSLFCDGTGDVLSTPNSTAFKFTGDFTVEGWVYPAVLGTTKSICSQRNSTGTQGWVFRKEANNYLSFSYGNGTAGWGYCEATTSALTLNTWAHVAVTFDGTTIRIFVNGTLSGSQTTLSGTRADSSTLFYVGRDRDGDTSRDWNGYIDELRITKGTARYTADFTAPTSFFQWEDTAPLTTVTTTLFAPYTSPWEENIPLITVTPTLFDPFTSPWQENIPTLTVTPQAFAPSDYLSLTIPLTTIVPQLFTPSFYGRTYVEVPVVGPLTPTLYPPSIIDIHTRGESSALLPACDSATDYTLTATGISQALLPEVDSTMTGIAFASGGNNVTATLPETTGTATMIIYAIGET